MRLWAMRTRPLSAKEEALLLAALPITLQERLLAADAAARQKSLWTYSLLRLALWESYHMELPDIAWSEQGKPYFPRQQDLYFNLSHTEGAVLVGISQREIGVDIEKDREPPVRLRKVLQTEAPFFSQWIQWEACAKCLGVSVLSLLRKGVQPGGVTYYEAETFSGYWSGVAVQGGSADVTVRLVEQEELLPVRCDRGKD